MGVLLLDPTTEPAEHRAELATRRFTSLNGVRLGLVTNTKLNADAIVLALGDLLAERYALAGVVHRQKPNHSAPAPDDIVDLIAREADVVIAGVGD
jgi:hypothetical protein